MGSKTNSVAQIISLPKGGGALHGIGEKFSPDLHTGSGNFTVPVAIPPGRNGFQPSLGLVYSTGNGNGLFGLGWNLSIPGVVRKTSHGIPRYQDDAPSPEDRDVFILSGAEDLVEVERAAHTCQYRPRTEGLFARILRHRDPSANTDYWEVRSKDGLVSYYGRNPAPGEHPQPPQPDPAAGVDGSQDAIIFKPHPDDSPDPRRIFAWKLTLTKDPFGNRIEYLHEADEGQDGPHRWRQPLLKQIRYADHLDGEGKTRFLVTVSFEYEPRPDPYSEYRSGFEIRTTQRCLRIEVRTHAQSGLLVRAYDFVYLDQRTDLSGLGQIVPINGLSLLSQIKVTGYDGAVAEELPPLEFGYTRFSPEKRDFIPVTGPDLPSASLANPNCELADLIGNGLPDILETNGSVRYWRNLGSGRFDQPREMKTAPAGVHLADPGVQLLDANGDGRMDLLITTPDFAGYYPMALAGSWDAKSFQKYKTAPSFNLEDPEVKLLDLDGDGITDAIRSGSRLECFFNDPHNGWTPERTRWVERRASEEFPNISFSDPRVRWADMSGDGMLDVVLLYDGNVEYWPNLGHGDWGKRISMRHCPRFPYGYDPKRILLGDVDGDGLADIVYVDDTQVTLWINRCGNSWSDPIVIQGTPPVSDMDAIRLVDLFGSGISGIVWSSDADGVSRNRMFFLDFAGAIKPYLVNEMNNHMGAITRVEYSSSTRFYLEDQQHLRTRWKTPLPFPVQVVARVEVIDELSKGKLTTEYRYRHGYWDGAEREFRGFGLVEQCDTETFEAYNAPGLHGQGASFLMVEDKRRFSPPTLTKTWFHQGPVGEESGDWEELDYTAEFWVGDFPRFRTRPEPMEIFLKNLPRRARRDALRALRGSVLRTELYALDGTIRQDRPHTVTESLFGVWEVHTETGEPRLTCEPTPDDPAKGTLSSAGSPPRVLFPHRLAQRTTQWERGDDPMTQFAFTEDYDHYGQPQKQTQIACPRGWRDLDSVPLEPYLATRSRTVFAVPLAADGFIRDRVAKSTTWEILNQGGQTVLALKELPDDSSVLKVIGQTLHFYDGPAFRGLGLGELGKYGALTRSESLVLTDDLLKQAYTVGDDDQTPAYLAPEYPPSVSAEYPPAFAHALPIKQADDPSRPEFSLNPLGCGLPKPSFPDCEQGYFVATERRRYDFQDPAVSQPRGLLLATRDPLGAADGNRDTRVTYDAFALLPAKVTDPVGLETTAEHDYRVLQPVAVTDPNGNRTEFNFSPLGLLTETRAIGKPTVAGEGDKERASLRLEHRFRAFLESPPHQRQPVFMRTTRFCHHDTETDVPDDERQKTIQTVEYSDGFGRLLQTRTQGEDVLFGDAVFGGDVLPATQGDPATTAPVVGHQNTDEDNPNVVVSGWQTYDNKGRVVEKYEPFFSTGWRYRSPDEERTVFGREVLGQKATMYYDPRGHVIRTVNPDGSEQRVVQGVPGAIAKPDLSRLDTFEPTPWEAYTYDANDNAGRTHFTASLDYRHHWDTPSSVLVDALGRTVKAVVRNREKPKQADLLEPIEEHRTRSTYDIQGNLLTVTDPLGRVAFRHAYDLVKQALRVENIDAGIRRTVFAASGNVMEYRDSKGALILHAYDRLNRPTRLWARDHAAGSVTLREQVEYGDGGDPQQPVNDRAANRTLNRLGKPHRHHDEAGVLSLEGYDFKGNVLEKLREVIADEAILEAMNDQTSAGFQVDWDSPQTTFVDETGYRTTTAYDALNRVKSLQYPRDVDGGRKVLRPRYNRAGAMEGVNLDDTVYVQRIAYNAKGQRSLIAYGNGVMTRHAYNPMTFRLTWMRSERFTIPSEPLYQPHGGLLQDLFYDYDLAGNILRITDLVPGCGVSDNPWIQDYPELAIALQQGDALVREFES